MNRIESRLQRVAGSSALPLAAVGLALVLSACGPSGNRYTGTYGPQPPSSTPAPPSTVSAPGLASNGDMIDDPAIYAEIPQNGPIDDIEVTVLPPDDPGAPCNDGTTDSAGHGPVTPGVADYDGCTLADLNSDIDSIEVANTFDPSVPVLVTTADGQLVNASGEMELSGHSTLLAPQKSFKIKLDKHGPTWYGQSRFPLKKHPYDLTRIRNTLAFELFRNIPDFASRRVHFMHLYITDQQGSTAAGTARTDYGLFGYVEENKDDWMAAHGQNPAGQLWKAGNFIFGPAVSTPGLQQDADSDAFQAVLKEEGKHYDAGTLLAMLDALNDGQEFLSVTYGNDFETVFNHYFHPDNFRTWLATNILVGNLDTNSQNFYLYQPTATGPFYFLPWDYDGAFDWNDQPPADPRPRWVHGLSNWWGMVLVRRYIQASGEVQKLTDKVNQLYSTALSPSQVRSVIDALPLTQVKALTLASPDLAQLPLNPASAVSAGQQWQAEVNRLPGTVTAARAQYLDNLDRPMPVFQNVEVLDGVVTLEWDPSYSIPGHALSYDVTLATSPTMTGNDPGCTAQQGQPAPMSDPVPQLSTGVVLQKTGVTGLSLAAPANLAPGRYYLQVVVRDAQGYCQTAFDEYDDGAGNPYFGVYAFKYDGSTVTFDGG